MIEFEILKNSNKSRARLGLIKTEHGLFETPCLVPVATQAVVKTLTSEEAKNAKSQILIANAFHLHLRPGEKIIESSGGLHKFMNWPGALMTDSGGFQIFSLGFGKDFGIGKILKDSQSSQVFNKIKEGDQPKLLKISDEGVFFRSLLDGREFFLGPEKSIRIQEKLGADIIFAFDECTPPNASYEYTKKSLERTNRWAKICLETKKSNQALFGIIQGGRYKNLRKESAKFIGSLPFDGFGIGGEFGANKKAMSQMLDWVIKELPPEKPRHLLGIGYLEDIPKIIKAGIDLFDCNVPTHYARRGIVFQWPNFARQNLTGVTQNKLNLRKAEFLKDKKPLDPKCSCFVCQNYKRNYLAHLFRANEITALSLLTFHNLYLFNTFVEKIREKIKKGQF